VISFMEQQVSLLMLMVVLSSKLDK
jgi:hypothetical protein